VLFLRAGVDRLHCKDGDATTKCDGLATSKYSSFPVLRLFPPTSSAGPVTNPFVHSVLSGTTASTVRTDSYRPPEPGVELETAIVFLRAFKKS